MSPPLARAERLRAYDSARRAFVEDCASRAEAGGFSAGADARALDDLAAEIAGALMIWAAEFERLDLARDARSRRPARFDIDRAGALVVEAVFDELLTPSATRLLDAAVALAEPAIV